MSVLLLTASGQGMFLATALLLRRRGNTLANRFLAAFTIALSIGLVDGFLIETNYYLLYPRLFGAALAINFLFGPLFYFYVKTLTSPISLRLRGKQLLHLLPMVLVLTLYLVSLFLFRPHTPEITQLGKLAQAGPEQHPLPGSRGLSITLGIDISLAYLGQHPFPDFNLILLLIIIQMAVYLFLSLKLIKAHSLRIRNNYSSLEKINLSWLRFLLIAFFCLWILFTFHFFLTSVYGLYRETVYLFYLLIALVIYALGLKGLLQPQVFDRLGAVQQDNLSQYRGYPGPTAAKRSREQNHNRGYGEKYKKSALTNEQAQRILGLLTRLMETEKPYLEPDLTMPELARRLLVSPNKLSQVLNGELDKNFFDFINAYRVEEAKKLMLSSKSKTLSILGISMDVGFNSNSAFYAAFKKNTGMTPSQFIKSAPSR